MASKTQVLHWLFFDLSGSGRANPHVLLASKAMQRVLAVFQAVGKTSQYFTIHAFALTVIQSHGFKCLLPLQTSSATDKRKTWQESFFELDQLTLSNTDQNVAENVIACALKEAYRNFHQLGELKGNCVLRVNFLTTRECGILSNEAEAILAQWDWSTVRDFCLVTLVDPNPVLTMEFKEPPQPASSKPQVDCVVIKADEFILEGRFKTWLKSSCLDSKGETLVLHLIGGAGALTCDASEIMINALLLPFPHSFSLNLSDKFLAQGAIASGTKSCVPHLDLPGPELEILFPVKRTGFCLSLIYGQPLRLVPTLNPNFDWKDLRSNQKLFEICREELREQEAFFIAKTLPRTRLDQVRGTFVIIPGADALLLFPAAAREIYLPFDDLLFIPNGDEEAGGEEDSISVEQSKTAIHAMISSSVRDVYNPLEVSTGLYDVLLTRPAVPSKVAGAGSKLNLPHFNEAIRASLHPVTLCDFPPREPKTKAGRQSKLRRS